MLNFRRALGQKAALDIGSRLETGLQLGTSFDQSIVGSQNLILQLTNFCFILQLEQNILTLKGIIQTRAAIQ